MSHMHKLPMESIVRAARGSVCPICYQRPHGSEKLANAMTADVTGSAGDEHFHGRT